MQLHVNRTLRVEEQECAWREVWRTVNLGVDRRMGSVFVYLTVVPCRDELTLLSPLSTLDPQARPSRSQVQPPRDAFPRT